MSKALHGTFVDEVAAGAEQQRDELYVVVLDRVDKELASELLVACIEVLEQHDVAGSVHRTEDGGILLAGHRDRQQ